MQHPSLPPPDLTVFFGVKLLLLVAPHAAPPAQSTRTRLRCICTTMCQQQYHQSWMLFINQRYTWTYMESFINPWVFLSFLCKIRSDQIHSVLHFQLVSIKRKKNALRGHLESLSPVRATPLQHRSTLPRPLLPSCPSHAATTTTTTTTTST